MRGIWLPAILLSLFFSPGCGNNEPPKKKSGLEIHAPGLDIKIDKDKGVDVKARGTDVRVNKENGVDVKAPGVDIEARPAKGRTNSDPDE